MPPYSTSATVRSGYVAANSVDIGAPFGNAHENRAIGADRIHHRAHVVHTFFEWGRRDVAIGEPEAALVEADQTAE